LRSKQRGLSERGKAFLLWSSYPGYLCGVSTEPMSLEDGKVGMASEYFEWRARAFADDTDGLA